MAGSGTDWGFAMNVSARFLPIVLFLAGCAMQVTRQIEAFSAGRSCSPRHVGHHAAAPE